MVREQPLQRLREILHDLFNQSVGRSDPVPGRDANSYLGVRDMRLHRQFRCRHGVFGGHRLARERRVHLHRPGELRIGTHSATPADVVNHPSNPSLGGGEIEQGTINRYLTLGVNYRPSADWNVNLLVPYVVRTHSTYGTQVQPYTAAETAPDQVSGAHVDSLGDIKLIGNYQGLLPTHNLGLQLGVKLPTGHYGTAVSFDHGPDAGSPLDASLQAGTGSTDVILGAYYYQAVSQDFDLFTNVQFQSAVAHQQNQPGNDFRPGNLETFSVGVR